MRIITFDIGIKNMAYCIIHIENNTFKVSQWDILNLMDEPAVYPLKCNAMLKTKSVTKGLNQSIKKECGKNAIFKKDGHFYCNKHANEQTRWFLSPKMTASIRKMKIDEVNEKITELSIVIDGTTRKDKVDALCNHIIANSLEEIPKNKMTSQEMNLINVGRNMTRLLDAIPEIETITHAIIENQISTIATRMKTIQGMLAQYFIMKCPVANIEFISSSNKLKDFYASKVSPPTLISTASISTAPISTASISTASTSTALISSPTTVPPLPPSTREKTKSSYKDNKLNSILYCSKVIDANVCLQEWKQPLSAHKKKDDLFDAFLQGMWFLKHNNIITYDDKCRIVFSQTPR